MKNTFYFTFLFTPSTIMFIIAIIVTIKAKASNKNCNEYLSASLPISGNIIIMYKLNIILPIESMVALLSDGINLLV